VIAEDLVEDGKQVAAEDVGRNKAIAKWGGDCLAAPYLRLTLILPPFRFLAPSKQTVR